MTRSVSKKILLVLAVWCLSSGLALADTFDLTDELQNAFTDSIVALESDLDEMREVLDDEIAPNAYLPPGVSRLLQFFFPLSSSDLPVPAVSRSLQNLIRNSIVETNNVRIG